MLKKPNRKKARSKALSLLGDYHSQLQFSNPFLDLWDLASFLDLELQEFDPLTLRLKETDPDKISAFFSYDENIILFNKNHSKNRVRFSIAHELGHQQLDHNSFPHETSYNPTNWDEIEANTFASELLIPSFSLKSDKEKNLSVEEIASKYGVSLEATRLRLSLDIVRDSKTYDIAGVKSNVTASFRDFEDTFDSQLFPPSNEYEDDYDEAYEYYSNFELDALLATLRYMRKNEEFESYPETRKAIKSLIRACKTNDIF